MGTFDNVSNGKLQIRLLLQWRWLVLAIAIPVSLVIEVLEGESRGLHFLDEFLIDGFIVPATTWIVLTFAARIIAWQTKRGEILEQRQRLMQCLTEHRDYDDLTEFIVRFPATLLPLEYAALFVYNADYTRLDFVTSWNHTGDVGGSQSHYMVLPSTCHNCIASQNLTLHYNNLCTAHGHSEYCIPLVHEQKVVGILRLRFQTGKAPVREQLESVTMLAPEIAQALTMAIEDYRQAEQAYREAQAQERRRIAHELHDTLAQQIFYLHLSLDLLSNDTTLLTTEAARRKVGSLRDVAADVYDQVRNNLSVLRTWEQIDLTEAVREMARLTAHDHSLAITIDVQGKPEWLSPHTSEHLYGVVREALNNVVKHAHAQYVQLELNWSAEQVTISITDDGIGFNPSVPLPDGHYGLTLMREAVEALHGTLCVESQPNIGTRLRAEVPLQRPRFHLHLRQEVFDLARA